MTPELLEQRRWARIAELLEMVTTGVVEAVLMPHGEGGGLLIIYAGRAYHFHTFKAAVNVDVSNPDTGEMLEGRRNCFRFDAPLEATVKAVAAEVLK